MRRPGVLSPRGGARPAPEDLAERGWLERGQRVDRSRSRRRVARRVGRWAARAALVALGLTTLGAAVAGGAWLLGSPRFAVTAIEVRGQSRLTAEGIVAAAGVTAGTNLWRVDPAAVAARLEALPLVRHAEVIRHWPDRLTIVVDERRPFTLVHAGRLHWIDEQGIALGPEPRAAVPGAPVISGLRPADLQAPRASESGRVAAGVSLLRLLLRSSSALLQEISEIDVSRPEGPVLYTVDGVEVRLGAEEWEARLARLDGVLAQLRAGREAVTAIDLRFRDQVVLRPAAR